MTAESTGCFVLQVAYLRQRICNAVTDCQHLHHSLAPKLAIWRQNMIYKPKNCVPAINHRERGNAYREKKKSTHLAATDNVMAPVIWCTFVTHLSNSIGRADTASANRITVIAKT